MFINLYYRRFAFLFPHLFYSIKIDDKLSQTEDKKYNYVKQSLKMKSDGQYIYDIVQWTSLSYEQYYATVHNYTDDNLNDIGNNIKAYKDEIGIGVAKYTNPGEIETVQYILFGDFSKYKITGNEYSHPSYVYTSTDRYATSIAYALRMEYGDNYSDLYDYNYDLKTKEVTVTKGEFLPLMNWK